MLKFASEISERQNMILTLCPSGVSAQLIAPGQGVSWKEVLMASHGDDQPLLLSSLDRRTLMVSSQKYQHIIWQKMSRRGKV